MTLNQIHTENVRKRFTCLAIETAVISESPVIINTFREKEREGERQR